MSSEISHAVESTMEILRLVHERGDERFEIVQSTDFINTTEEWFYVYRYVAGRNTHDYLQPGIKLATLCAQKQWNVPRNRWRVAHPGEVPLHQ